MATIIDVIQSKLGFAPLQKVDPNIQEARHNEQRSVTEKLAQAAIPSVLAAMLKLSRTDTGTAILTRNDANEKWTASLFGGNKDSVVEKVAQYAGVSAPEAEATMDKVAMTAVTVVNEKVAEKKGRTLNEYLGSERHHILVYLPAALQLGYLLNDQVMDDRTNKMEGPVSNLMHKIENAMSKNDQTKYP